jgi:hypothetical protein
VNDAVINKPCFFDSRNDFNRMPQTHGGLTNEIRGSSEFSQGTRSNNTNGIGMNGANTFTESRQAIEGDFLTVFTSRQSNHFTQPVDHFGLPMGQPGNDHVKAVGTQVNSGENFGFRATLLIHDSEIERDGAPLVRLF